MALDPDALPASARELAEVVGLAATLRLVECYGGRRLWVPQAMTAEHWVAKLIGLKAAKRLSEHYGLDQFDVPRCLAAVLAARDAEIRRRYADGETAGVLTGDYHLTERTIYRIASSGGDGAPRRQMQLL